MVFLYLYCGYRAVLYVIIHYVSLTLSFLTETCVDRCVFILGNVCMYRNYLSASRGYFPRVMYTLPSSQWR